MCVIVAWCIYFFRCRDPNTCLVIYTYTNYNLPLLMAFASIKCPITCDVMDDPVMCGDGHTYEKAAIQEWLQRSHTSPVTNEVLHHKRLVENHAVKQIIAEMRTSGAIPAAVEAPVVVVQPEPEPEHPIQEEEPDEELQRVLELSRQNYEALLAQDERDLHLARRNSLRTENHRSAEEEALHHILHLSGMLHAGEVGRNAGGGSNSSAIYEVFTIE